MLEYRIAGVPPAFSLLSTISETLGLLGSANNSRLVLSAGEPAIPYLLALSAGGTPAIPLAFLKKAELRN